MNEQEPKSGGPRSPGSRLCLAVFVITLCVHALSLRSGYVYDDVEAILENPSLTDASQLPSLFATDWGERNIGLYRPIVQVTYLMEGATVGFSPRVSHGINAILHALVAVLVCGFALRLGLSSSSAFVAATLFGVHPALLDAAVWISGRTDVLSTGFLLAALYLAEGSAWKRGLISPAGAGIALLWLLALLSKEMAATLPLFLLLRHGRIAFRLAPSCAVALGAYIALRAYAVEGFLPGELGQVLAGRPFLERFAIGSRACLRLLGLSPVPFGLAADHRAHSWAAANAPIGLTGFFSMLLVGFVLPLVAWRNRGARVPSFLLGATLLSLLPILQLIPIGALMAERFLYLPAVFVLPAMVWAAQQLLPRRLLPLIGTAALVVAATLTITRLPVYASRGAFAKDVLRAYPNDHKAWNNLGVWYAYEQDPLDFAQADRAFEQALEAHPPYRRGRLNRARARLREHRLMKRVGALGGVEEMVTPLARRGDPDALYLRGKLGLRRAKSAAKAMGRERLERALTDYRRAAATFERQGKPARAAAAWKEAGLASGRLGDQDQRCAAFETSLRLNPQQDGADAMRRALSRKLEVPPK